MVSLLRVTNPHLLSVRSTIRLDLKVNFTVDRRKDRPETWQPIDWVAVYEGYAGSTLIGPDAPPGEGWNVKRGNRKRRGVYAYRWTGDEPLLTATQTKDTNVSRAIL